MHRAEVDARNAIEKSELKKRHGANEEITEEHENGGGCFGNCFTKKKEYSLEDLNNYVAKAEQHDRRVREYEIILEKENINTNTKLMKYLKDNNILNDILFAANALSNMNRPRIRFGSRSPSPTPTPSLFERTSPLNITGAPKQ